MQRVIKLGHLDIAYTVAFLYATYNYFVLVQNPGALPLKKKLGVFGFNIKPFSETCSEKGFVPKCISRFVSLLIVNKFL